ncbi:MAG: hypothetical protein M0Z61_11295 [Nitrospiraceae bacterium]|nr:hypothetical protein [Nitrospiraceae bacterium]MDA8106466.1 hypothetical protein [Nitrospiraceae bacterium]
MIEQNIATFVRRNWYWLTVGLLIAAIFIQYQFGTVSFKSETVQRVIDNKIQESILIRPTNIYPIFIIVSNVFVSLAITIFISVFFMKVIESTEREKLAGNKVANGVRSCLLHEGLKCDSIPPWQDR